MGSINTGYVVPLIFGLLIVIACLFIVMRFISKSMKARKEEEQGLFKEETGSDFCMPDSHSGSQAIPRWDFELEIIEQYWVPNNHECDEKYKDFFSAGLVRLTLGDTILEDEVSTCLSSYNLLKTLSHIPVEEDHIFPHCGHAVMTPDANSSIAIETCSMGIYADIQVGENTVTISLKDNDYHVKPVQDGTNQAEVGYERYKEIVKDFCDQVKQFYMDSPNRSLPNEKETELQKLFWEEWNKLYSINFS